MPMIVAAMVVLAFLSLCAAPVLASQYGPGPDAQPRTVAAVDSFIKLDSKLKLDHEVTGTIKVDLGLRKDKWTVAGLKCADIKIVAASGDHVVATSTATAGGDVASCVYSMKVPGVTPLSVYAVIGGSSVKINGFHKLADGAFGKEPITSDLKTEGFLKYDQVKTGDEGTIKFWNGTQATLPLYLKIDSASPYS